MEPTNLIVERVKEVFNRRVEVGDPSACWDWGGSRGPSGYGTVSVAWRAARLAVVLDGRTLKPDDLVLHKCHNPPCVNPAHLKIGDQSENMHDRVANGYKNPWTFSDAVRDQVVARYLAGDRPKAIAAGEKMNQSTVFDIVNERFLGLPSAVKLPGPVTDDAQQRRVEKIHAYFQGREAF